MRRGAVAEALGIAAEALGGVLAEQFEEVRPAEPVGFQAERLLGRAVGAHDAVGVVELDDGVVRAVE